MALYCWSSYCGIRWMPWRQRAMKDVADCDKPRGGVKLPEIRGCPNGATLPE